MKFYLVAGELSGDLLGEGLINALRERYPNAEFRGLGGERMQRAGLVSLYPLDTLSVMGLVEVIQHLPRLFRVRHHLLRDALDWQPDVMIGIDAPDFTLGLEKRLRAKGMRTVHYVSPSVWAWRQWRIKGIKRAVDLMLTFLPFEADFYRKHQVPVAYVGHPLADSLPLEPETDKARQQLGLDSHNKVLAMLPGSRRSEVSLLLPHFIGAVRLLVARYPGMQFVIPAATPVLKHLILEQLTDCDDLNIRVTDARAHDAMTAADVVLLASGTAAFEAMLLKKPMVVAYQVSSLSYAIATRLATTRYVSLPNIIAGEALVPELLQHEVTPVALARSVSRWFDTPQEAAELVSQFHEFHLSLRRGASRRAADAITGLLDQAK